MGYPETLATPGTKDTGQRKQNTKTQHRWATRIPPQTAGEHMSS